MMRYRLFARACAAFLWLAPMGLDAQAATGFRTTSFNPAVHGFHFVNSFTNQVYTDLGLNLTFGGLCGGMVYSALDYFHTRTPLPSQRTLPAEGTQLRHYIWARQLNTFEAQGVKWAELFVNPFGWRTTEFFNWGVQGFNGGRLEELQAAIDRGTPVPLGLFAPGGGGLAPHHQVLAIGYRLGRYRGRFGEFVDDLRIQIYDPNHPDSIMILRPDSRAQRYFYENGDPHRREKETWLTYFVDRNYRTRQPGDPAVLDRCGTANFAGQNLSGQSRVAVLSEYRCGNFSGVNFRGATIAQSDFFRATFVGAILYGANARQANFTRANMTGVDFYGADLQAAEFGGARLDGARFIGANLKNAKLGGAFAVGADFTGADLYLTTLSGARLERANFSRASLNTAKLQGANLREANLSNANLVNADLTDANLCSANLTGANLQGAVLTRARRTGTRECESAR